MANFPDPRAPQNPSQGFHRQHVGRRGTHDGTVYAFTQHLLSPRACFSGAALGIGKCETAVRSMSDRQHCVSRVACPGALREVVPCLTVAESNIPELYDRPQADRVAPGGLGPLIAGPPALRTCTACQRRGAGGVEEMLWLGGWRFRSVRVDSRYRIHYKSIYIHS